MSAVFSPCGTWRYTLARELPGTIAWVESARRDIRTVLFVCLNPSTADETNDDPTVRRCIGFARRWGFDRLEVGNVFAYRSTDPKALRSAEDPVGPHNDYWLKAMAARADLVVAAWGFHGAFLGRGDRVRHMLANIAALHHLGLTSYGLPKHPLYLRADQEPTLWEVP